MPMIDLSVLTAAGGMCGAILAQGTSINEQSTISLAMLVGLLGAAFWFGGLIVGMRKDLKSMQARQDRHEELAKYRYEEFKDILTQRSDR